MPADVRLLQSKTALKRLHVPLLSGPSRINRNPNNPEFVDALKSLSQVKELAVTIHLPEDCSQEKWNNGFLYRNAGKEI